VIEPRFKSWPNLTLRLLAAYPKNIVGNRNSESLSCQHVAPAQCRILGTVQKQSGDLLAGNATLPDQLQQCILHFDVQELLQFSGEAALGRIEQLCL